MNAICHCKIVREHASYQGANWALYADGAYREHFDSQAKAQRAAIALCEHAHPSVLQLTVEDASGQRISFQKISRPGQYA